MDETKKIIGKNIKTLRTVYKKNQKEFSASAGISTPTLSSYENGTTLPSLEFLLYLKNTFNISIDLFISELLSPSEIQQTSSSSPNIYIPPTIGKYEGTYILYYYTTSTQSTQHDPIPSHALRTGLLTLYLKSNSSVSAIACFNLAESSLQNIYSTIIQNTTEREAAKNVEFIKKTYKTANETNVYNGYVDFSPNNIFIHLSHNNRDYSLIILKNPNSEQKIYWGGMGTMNSVSKGNSQDPCIECVALSRYPLIISTDEIARELQFSHTDLNLYNETIELINIFKKLYIDSSAISMPFSDEQKTYLVQSLLEKCVSETMTSNLFRTKKISSETDDKWYHIVKKHSIKEK